MAVKNNAFALLAIIVLMANAATSLRDFPVNAKPEVEQAATLQANEGGTNDCWGAMSELRQCSNEVIGFFLNGQTDIDTPCCNAIEFITHQCWPSMVAVLGLTTEEGNLLAGYCNKTSTPAGTSTTVTDNTHF